MPKRGKDTRPTGARGRELDAGVKHPRKALYRARAHSNPLNDSSLPVPVHPDQYNWAQHYPAFVPASAPADQSDDSSSAAAVEPPRVRFADVGCGFGGLLVALAPLYPDTLMLGLELRDKVSEYVRERVAALRRESGNTAYGNISVLRANAQKHLPLFFHKGQLTKLFFLFPDPHFKAGNHRRRIIQTSLLAEYAYVLAPGGWLYTVTDVQELGDWMADKLEAHPLFERVPEGEVEADAAARLLTSATEEGQKVARNQGHTWRHVFRRIPGLHKTSGR